MNHHREYLPDDTLLVDQIGGRAIVARGRPAIEIGHDMETRGGLDLLQDLAVRFQVLIFLGDSDHDRIALLELTQQILQLYQLRGTERSPEGPVGGYYDVLLAGVLRQGYGRAIRGGQLERLGLLTDLQKIFPAPVGDGRARRH